jgi:hypothetical protein
MVLPERDALSIRTAASNTVKLCAKVPDGRLSTGTFSFIKVTYVYVCAVSLHGLSLTGVTAI